MLHLFCPFHSVMFFVRLVRKILYLAVALGLIHVWLSRKSYIFDAHNIESIAKRHASISTASGTGSVADVRDALKNVVRDLRQHYTPFMLPDADLKWLKISHGGGGAIAICPIHVSMTEYIMLIGAALPSTAHTGRTWLNITVTPLIGSVEVWSDRYTSVKQTPGQTYTLLSGENGRVISISS